jgi:hypothetical protein
LSFGSRFGFTPSRLFPGSWTHGSPQQADAAFRD